MLAVVSAVAFGAYFYAEAVAGSLARGVDEKAYVAYGGDVQGVVSDTPRCRGPSRSRQRGSTTPTRP